MSKIIDSPLSLSLLISSRVHQWLGHVARVRDNLQDFLVCTTGPAQIKVKMGCKKSQDYHDPACFKSQKILEQKYAYIVCVALSIERVIFEKIKILKIQHLQCLFNTRVVSA